MTTDVLQINDIAEAMEQRLAETKAMRTVLESEEVRLASALKALGIPSGKPKPKRKRGQNARTMRPKARREAQARKNAAGGISEAFFAQVLDIITTSDEPLTIRMLIERTGASEGYVRTTIRKLVADGAIVVTGTGPYRGGPKLYAGNLA